MRVSVGTIVKGRRVHLRQLVAGLKAQDTIPDELVVVLMDEAPTELADRLPFPVRIVRHFRDYLPLAEARNKVAERAAGEGLIFLDVDCIPCPGLVRSYTDLLMERDACLMGPVRYLAEGEGRGGERFAVLWDGASAHPARLDPDTEPRGRVPIDDHGEFWSLSFALRAETFARTGGFDERFAGYGAEDTDFAQSLARTDVPLLWCRDARAVHQWHPVHKPPLHHFDDIVRNARLFFEKHGEWCMTYWLDQMAEMGLVRCDERTLTVVRRPSPDDLAATAQPGDVRFS